MIEQRSPSASATITLSDATVAAFDADVQAATETFRIPGAAVALVLRNRLVYARGFGVRNVDNYTPATPNTRFRIASNTKSMTSLLVATYVDEGILAWDAPVGDVWPQFRAPTPELTRQLRVRDLLGMSSGLAESPTVEFFMSAGTESALDQLRSVAHLPVIAPPDTEYHYNNTLVSAAGYLGPIAHGVPPNALEEAYTAAVTERIFDPIGMASSVIADDPRPYGDDYATGHTRALNGQLCTVPFVSIAGAAPAGAAMCSAIDMARYLIAHMNGGVGPDGRRIVSAGNLAQTHRPGIAVLPDAPNALPGVLLPDTVAMHYCLGWFDQTFTDGRHLLWHGGAIDGFGSQMGFLPDDKIGFVILTNLEPTYSAAFHVAVQSSLLRRLYGLNDELPEMMNDTVHALAEQAAALAARTRPVDAATVAPYLGLYAEGFQLTLDEADTLALNHDVRSMPMLALPDGRFVVADGPGLLAHKTVTFTNSGATPTMMIDGFEPVRWLTGG